MLAVCKLARQHSHINSEVSVHQSHSLTVSLRALAGSHGRHHQPRRQHNTPLSSHTPDGGSDARVIITEVISWVWTEDRQWRLVWGGSCDGLTTRKRSAYTFLELQHDSCAGPSPPLVFAILAVKWQLNTWINSARCLLPINKDQESKDKASDCDALTSLLSAPSNWRSVLLIIWLVQRPSDYRFGLLT